MRAGAGLVVHPVTDDAQHLGGEETARRVGAVHNPSDDPRVQRAQHGAVQLPVVVDVVKFEHGQEVEPEPAARTSSAEFDDGLAPAPNPGASALVRHGPPVSGGCPAEDDRSNSYVIPRRPVPSTCGL